jgi:hypothetical protein
MGDPFEFAPAWRPQPSDKLDYNVTELSMYDGAGYGAYPIGTGTLNQPARTKDGERQAGEEIAVHAFHTVLRNELPKHKPQVGERVVIFYGGKKRAGDTSYHVYAVRMPERPVQPFSWGDGEDPDNPTDGSDFASPSATTASVSGAKPGEPAQDDSDVPF